MPVEEPSMALLASGNSNRSKSRQAAAKAKVDEEKMTKGNTKIANTNIDTMIKDKGAEATETTAVKGKVDEERVTNEDTSREAAVKAKVDKEKMAKGNTKITNTNTDTMVKDKGAEATETTAVNGKVDKERVTNEDTKIANTGTDTMVKGKGAEATETPRMASKRSYVEDSDEDSDENFDEASDEDEVALEEEKPAVENKGAVKKQKTGKGKSTSAIPVPSLQTLPGARRETPIPPPLSRFPMSNAPPPSTEPVPANRAPEFITTSVVLAPGIERLPGNLMYSGPPHEPQTVVPAGESLRVISPENCTLLRKAHDKICRDYGTQPQIPADLWRLISSNPANRPIVTNWGVFFICSKETKHDNPIYKPWWHFYFDPVTGKKSTSCIKHEQKAPSWFVLTNHLAARRTPGTLPPQ